MSELKNCPFCDHKPTWHFTKRSTSQSGEYLQYYILGCFSPLCTIRPTITKNLACWAVAYWEQRPDNLVSYDEVKVKFKDVIEKVTTRMEKQQR